MRHTLVNFVAVVLMLSFVWAQEADITSTQTSQEENIDAVLETLQTIEAQEETPEVGPGIITFVLGLDWTQLWKQDATYEDVPESERKEWIEDTIGAALKIMKRKFNRPEVAEHKVIKFKDNSVLVEFPGLTGFSKEDLELISADFIQTITIKSIAAAYLDGQKIDLFGRSAAKEARSRAKKRERDTNHEFGIEDLAPTPETARTVEELRKAKEHQEEVRNRQDANVEKDRSRKEKLEKREKLKKEKMAKMTELGKQKQKYDRAGVEDASAMLERTVANFKKEFNEAPQQQRDAIIKEVDGVYDLINKDKDKESQDKSSSETKESEKVKTDEEHIEL